MREAVESLYAYQRFVSLFLVADTNRQIVAPGAPDTGPLEKTAGTDLAGNVSGLFEVLGKLLTGASGEMPLDPWFLGLDENAQRKPFDTRLSQIIRAELIGEDDLVRIKGRTSCFEVNDRGFARDIGLQVDDPDKGQVEARDPQESSEAGDTWIVFEVLKTKERQALDTKLKAQEKQLSLFDVRLKTQTYEKAKALASGAIVPKPCPKGALYVRPRDAKVLYARGAPDGRCKVR